MRRSIHDLQSGLPALTSKTHPFDKRHSVPDVHVNYEAQDYDEHAHRPPMQPHSHVPTHISPRKSGAGAGAALSHQRAASPISTAEAIYRQRKAREQESRAYHASPESVMRNAGPKPRLTIHQQKHQGQQLLEQQHRQAPHAEYGSPPPAYSSSGRFTKQSPPKQHHMPHHQQQHQQQKQGAHPSNARSRSRSRSGSRERYSAWGGVASGSSPAQPPLRHAPQAHQQQHDAHSHPHFQAAQQALSPHHTVRSNMHLENELQAAADEISRYEVTLAAWKLRYYVEHLRLNSVRNTADQLDSEVHRQRQHVHNLVLQHRQREDQLVLELEDLHERANPEMLQQYIDDAADMTNTIETMVRDMGEMTQEQDEWKHKTLELEKQVAALSQQLAEHDEAAQANSQNQLLAEELRKLEGKKHELSLEVENMQKSLAEVKNGAAVYPQPQRLGLLGMAAGALFGGGNKHHHESHVQGPAGAVTPAPVAIAPAPIEHINLTEEEEHLRNEMNERIFNEEKAMREEMDIRLAEEKAAHDAKLEAHINCNPAHSGSGSSNPPVDAVLLTLKAKRLLVMKHKKLKAALKAINDETPSHPVVLSVKDLIVSDSDGDSDSVDGSASGKNHETQMKLMDEANHRHERELIFLEEKKRDLVVGMEEMHQEDLQQHIQENESLREKHEALHREHRELRSRHDEMANAHQFLLQQKSDAEKAEAEKVAQWEHKNYTLNTAIRFIVYVMRKKLRRKREAAAAATKREEIEKERIKHLENMEADLLAEISAAEQEEMTDNLVYETVKQKNEADLARTNIEKERRTRLKEMQQEANSIRHELERAERVKRAESMIKARRGSVMAAANQKEARVEMIRRHDASVVLQRHMRGKLARKKNQTEIKSAHVKATQKQGQRPSVIAMTDAVNASRDQVQRDLAARVIQRFFSDMFMMHTAVGARKKLQNIAKKTQDRQAASIERTQQRLHGGSPTRVQQDENGSDSEGSSSTDSDEEKRGKKKAKQYLKMPYIKEWDEAQVELSKFNHKELTRLVFDANSQKEGLQEMITEITWRYHQAEKSIQDLTDDLTLADAEIGRVMAEHKIDQKRWVMKDKEFESMVGTLKALDDLVEQTMLQREVEGFRKSELEMRILDAEERSFHSLGYSRFLEEQLFDARKREKQMVQDADHGLIGGRAKHGQHDHGFHDPGSEDEDDHGVDIPITNNHTRQSLQGNKRPKLVNVRGKRHKEPRTDKVLDDGLEDFGQLFATGDSPDTAASGGSYSPSRLDSRLDTAASLRSDYEQQIQEARPAAPVAKQEKMSHEKPALTHSHDAMEERKAKLLAMKAKKEAKKKKREERKSMRAPAPKPVKQEGPVELADTVFPAPGNNLSDRILTKAGEHDGSDADEGVHESASRGSGGSESVARVFTGEGAMQPEEEQEESVHDQWDNDHQHSAIESDKEESEDSYSSSSEEEGKAGGEDDGTVHSEGVPEHIKRSKEVVQRSQGILKTETTMARKAEKKARQAQNALSNYKEQADLQAKAVEQERIERIMQGYRDQLADKDEKYSTRELEVKMERKADVALIAKLQQDIINLKHVRDIRPDEGNRQTVDNFASKGQSRGPLGLFTGSSKPSIHTMEISVSRPFGMLQSILDLANEDTAFCGTLQQIRGLVEVALDARAELETTAIEVQNKLDEHIAGAIYRRSAHRGVIKEWIRNYTELTGRVPEEADKNSSLTFTNMAKQYLATQDELTRGITSLRGIALRAEMKRYQYESASHFILRLTGRRPLPFKYRFIAPAERWSEIEDPMSIGGNSNNERKWAVAATDTCAVLSLVVADFRGAPNASTLVMASPAATSPAAEKKARQFQTYLGGLPEFKSADVPKDRDLERLEDELVRVRIDKSLHESR